jgi:hypothetical protein
MCRAPVSLYTRARIILVLYIIRILLGNNENELGSRIENNPDTTRPSSPLNLLFQSETIEIRIANDGINAKRICSCIPPPKLDISSDNPILSWMDTATQRIYTRDM